MVLTFLLRGIYITNSGFQETEQIIGYKIFEFGKSKHIKVNDFITQKEI